MPRETALVPLLWVHAFRIVGGSILAPGSVGVGVPAAFQTMIGLGDLGIRYGYQRFMPEMMLAVVVVLIVLVQTVQTAGDYLARRVNRRLRHR